MGENVLHGQVESFKKKRDRSLKKMSAPTLFDRPDIMSTIYTATPTDSGEPKVGTRLDAHVAADGRCVLLVDGHVVVARIEGDGAASLLNGLREPGSSGIASVRVQKISPISKCLDVIVDDGKEPV